MAEHNHIRKTSKDMSVEEAIVAPPTTWDPKSERKLVRKMDIRILPCFIVLFILNFVDRNNFANARLRGLEDDLKLTDVQYQTCISILLVGYVLMQVPSNMILNAVTRPAWYLSGCVATWGIISASMGAVQNAGGAIACRFLLGCVEASFFPGSLYFLSRWYTRREMQLRVTILNAGNLVAQAFGGLIAAGILGSMQGASGLAAWRWLFIIEGSITIACAAIALFILPQYPSTTSWLTDEEKNVAIARLSLEVGAEARSTEGEDLTSKQGLFLALKDRKVWILGITYMSFVMGCSFVYFFPTITQALGYDITTTLLLTAPPWIFAVFVSLPNAWNADRTGERFIHYSWPCAVGIIGYIISIATTGTAPRYVSMFMMTTGFSAGFVILAWISNTIPYPAAKKASAIAIVNAMGNIGSIPGAYIWPASFGPLYIKSFAAEIAILGFSVIMAFVLRCYLRRENQKLDAANATNFQPQGDLEKTSPPESQDAQNKFRYLY